MRPLLPYVAYLRVSGTPTVPVFGRSPPGRKETAEYRDTQTSEKPAEDPRPWEEHLHADKQDHHDY
jgi:hypothetical protein